VAFLGSDAHNVDKRPPNLAEAAALIEKKLGGETLAALRQTEEAFGLYREVRR
jgi:tyrosine-protein phosphatase YwqE